MEAGRGVLCFEITSVGRAERLVGKGRWRETPWEDGCPLGGDKEALDGPKALKGAKLCPQRQFRGEMLTCQVGRERKVERGAERCLICAVRQVAVPPTVGSRKRPLMQGFQGHGVNRLPAFSMLPASAIFSKVSTQGRPVGGARGILFLLLLGRRLCLHLVPASPQKAVLDSSVLPLCLEDFLWKWTSASLQPVIPQDLALDGPQVRSHFSYSRGAGWRAGGLEGFL